ncbi:hypothetical protein ACWGJ9_11040 [Curtobacterium citreum]
MTMLQLVPPSLGDPVVVYDIMREAGNRLIAAILENVTHGGMDDPAIREVRAVRAELRAVPLDDLAAQTAKTEELVERERQMRAA